MFRKFEAFHSDPTVKFGLIAIERSETFSNLSFARKQADARFFFSFFQLSSVYVVGLVIESKKGVTSSAEKHRSSKNEQKNLFPTNVTPSFKT